MTDTPGVYRYLELVKGQQKAITNMSAGERAAQLGYSSLDDTFLPVLDALGQVRMAVGRQPDNTYAVTYANGDPPPTPTAPVVAPREGAALVGWDGNFAGGYKKPGDFSRIDIHVSETPDFVPDGSTVVGYLLGEAATLVPIDHVTHYVKLVAVTLADVISAPTAQAEVLPEPIGQIAAGAIGAGQLATDILLTNHRLIAGGAGGARLEFNSYAGLELFNQAGQRTIHLDNNTGNAVFVGEIRTKVENAGRRMVWNPGWMGEDGEQYIGIQFFNTSATSGNDSAGFVAGEEIYPDGRAKPVSLLIGPSWGTGTTKDYTTFKLSDQLNFSINKFYPDRKWAYGRVSFFISQRTTQITMGVHPLTTTTNNNYPHPYNGEWYGVFYVQNPQVEAMPVSFNGFRLTAPNGDELACGMGSNLSSGRMYFNGNGSAQFANSATTAFIDVTAKQFIPNSSAEAKEAFRAPGESMLTAVRQAPISVYQYKDSDDSNELIGPMAEDMPAWAQQTIYLQDPDENRAEETIGLSLNNQIGILFAALRELDEEIDELRDAARPRITKPKRKKRSNAT